MRNRVYTTIWFFSIEFPPAERRAAGERVLHKMIKEITGNRTVKLGRHPSGKPFIAYPEGLCYNISHSGQLGICALSTHEIGIDLERFKTSRDIAGISEKWFSGPEVKDLKKSDYDPEHFFLMWTRKEAWLKERGYSVWKIKTTPPMHQRYPSVKSWLIETDTTTYALSVSGNTENISFQTVPSLLHPPKEVRFPFL